MKPKTLFSLSAIFIALVFLFLGCAFFDHFTKFPVKYSKTFTIPQGIPTNIPYDIYTPYFPTNSEKYFTERNTRSDLIEGCTAEKMVGYVIMPSMEDFSFIRSIHIFLTARDLPTVEVAYRDDIPDGTDTLNFNVQDVQLLEYIKKDSIGFRVQVLTDRVNKAELHTRIKVEFIIDAKILGV